MSYTDDCQAARIEFDDAERELRLLAWCSHAKEYVGLGYSVEQCKALLQHLPDAIRDAEARFADLDRSKNIKERDRLRRELEAVEAKLAKGGKA